MRVRASATLMRASDAPNASLIGPLSWPNSAPANDDDRGRGRRGREERGLFGGERDRRQPDDRLRRAAGRRCRRARLGASPSTCATALAGARCATSGRKNHPKNGMSMPPLGGRRRRCVADSAAGVTRERAR